MKKLEKNTPEESLPRLVWVLYVCSNPKCLNKVGQRNFELVPLREGQEVSDTLTCTGCMSIMNKKHGPFLGGDKTWKSL